MRKLALSAFVLAGLAFSGATSIAAGENTEDNKKDQRMNQEKAEHSESRMKMKDDKEYTV